MLKSNIKSQTKSNILVKMSGSIAAFKVCTVISFLKKAGFNVKVICTKNTFEFVGRATLEGLSGEAVLCDQFASGEAMNHISLDRWADLILFAPATANSINKMAAGLAEDLPHSLFLAHDFKKPYLLAPAMNVEMWNHPSTQASLQKLSSWGVKVLSPEVGVLACGEVGTGRLLEPEQILDKVLQTLCQRAERKKILVTSGATREALDSVRFLSNFSTGQTAAQMAQNLISDQYQITYVSGVGSAKPLGAVKSLTYTDYESLRAALAKELSEHHYDLVVHAAAVSDYSVGEKKASGKIDSSEVPEINLKKNAKILNQLKSFSKNPDLQVIGFKLTDTSDKNFRLKKVQDLFALGDLDFVIHNDLSDYNENKRQFSFYSKENSKFKSFTDIENLTQLLGELL